MSDTSEAPGGSLGTIISVLARWASPDLINLSHAITEMIERRGAPKQPSLKEIREAVAAVAGVPVDDLSSERRDRDVKRPRKVAMALCRHFTRAGFPRIGKSFGRNHTAVWRACRQLEPLITLATQTLPPDATIGDWAALMLANYEHIVGVD